MGDFAIVTLNNNVSITNKICSTLNVVGTYSSLPEGTTIYKYGGVTGLSYGTIMQSAIYSATRYTGADDQVYHVRGLYRSSMQNANGTDAVAGGDSGGPVYIQDGSNYLLHGIVTAKENPKQGGVVRYMYSTPIFYAMDVGFTVKTD